MKNRMRVGSCFIWLLFFAAPAISQTPPPPLGPPSASSEAGGSFLILFLRTGLQNAGQQVIDTANNQLKTHPSIRAKLSWASNARPLECDYDCMSAPTIEKTQYIDRPNTRRVVHRGRLSFRVSDIKRKVGGVWVPAASVRRTIHTNVDFYAYCEGWEGKEGGIRIYTKARRPFIDESHSTVESILNFILLPLNISNIIDTQLSRQFKSQAGLPAFEAPNGDCNSLGIISNAPSGPHSRNDNIIWDRPVKKKRFNQKAALLREEAVVRFMSIKRRKTLNSLTAGQDELRFTFYVNGQAVEYPSNANKIKILENRTHQLSGGVSLKIPLSKKDAVLQVFAANNLMASGWKEHTRRNKYGDGTRTLVLRRKIVAPNQNIPGARKGGSNKPAQVVVSEFELTYTISYRGQLVVKDNPVQKSVLKKR